MDAFPLAYTTGTDAPELARALLAGLGTVPPGANLGFLYATDALAPQLGPLTRLLRDATGIEHWTGTVGLAINVTGEEFYDQPAVAVMLGTFPDGAFDMLPPLTGRTGEDLMLRPNASLAVLHGDPDNPLTPTLVQSISQAAPALFSVGGVTSSQRENLQICDDVTQGGVSGVVFDASVEVVTNHTQGCTPIGPRHRITHSQNNIIAGLDGRDALDVFEEDIGEVLAKNLERVGGFIFAGLPIAGSDTGDYMVRNLIGIDTGQKMIAIGDYAEEGREIMFCRRDGNSATQDMRRMLDELRKQLAGRPIRGGLYFSCLGRGRYQFGENSEELRMIRDELGEFPLVGFFANGEIYNGRLYGFTGVLTLFI
ncbi:MAG: FIST C-terminal domain-containing protein [Gammaproteobacteria bacterium]|jgi:small ligand-binding sensory domain FIST